MDLVGRAWAEAKAILEEIGCPYTWTRTKPTRDFFAVDESLLYVVRDNKDAAGARRLVVAAKLAGKGGVLNDGLYD